MRKLITILFLITSFFAKGQFDMLPTKEVGSQSVRGLWGYAAPLTIANNIRNNAHFGTPAAWVGYHITTYWSEIETSDNNFVWTTLDNRIQLVKDSGLLVGVEIMVGPNSPSWLITLAGSFTTTTGITYPKYYNPVYSLRYYRLLRKLAEHFASVGGVLEWEISEGTTGDAQPYHGTLVTGVGDPFVPQNPNGADWEDFRHIAWDSARVDQLANNLTDTHLEFQTGLDAQNVDVAAGGRYGVAWGKKTDPSHYYTFNSAAQYPLRPYLLSRGECQDEILTSLHKNKDAYALIMNMIGTQLDILNTGPEYYNQLVGTDLRFNSIFNYYANDTIPETSRHAVIKLGMLISIDSTTYWPESTFGALINPAQTAAYNAAITAINNSLVDSPSYKRYERMVATIAYHYATRVNNLTTGTGTTAINNYGTAIDYDNDFAYSALQNWGRFITENDAKTNSFPLYRVTPDTSIYGRFAKQFTATNLMSFDIAENWNFGAAFATVNFSIAYKDSGTDSWGVQVYNSAGTLTTIATQTNTNTGEWLVKTFSTTMYFKVGEDFRLIHSSGSDNVIFDTISLNADPSS